MTHPRVRAMAEPVRRWSVFLAGVVLVWLSVAVGVGIGGLRVPSAAYASLPLAFSGVVCVAGYRLANRTERGRNVVVPLAWLCLGAAAMLGLSWWFHFVNAFDGGRAPAVVRAVAYLTSGALFGLLVGLGNMRARVHIRRTTEARVERENLRERQRTLALLDQILRHHLLNDLSVIGGYAGVLADRADAAGREHAETVERRAEEMAETIRTIRSLTDSLLDECDLVPVDAAATADEQLARARDSHPDAAFERADDVETAPVLANDLLGMLLANLLNNAVQHNDAPDPRVEVTIRERGERVLLTIADNGPGVPPDRRDRIFEASERGSTSDGDGLGLFLTRTVVEQYGGEMRIDDNEPRGAAFTVALPAA